MIGGPLVFRGLHSFRSLVAFARAVGGVVGFIFSFQNGLWACVLVGVPFGVCGVVQVVALFLYF